MNIPSTTPDIAALQLRIAASRELLHDTVNRAMRMGRTVNIDALRDESCRAFAAKLIADGVFAWEEVESFCLDYQVQRLNQLARDLHERR